MRGNSPVRFGKGPTEKDPSHGHLAGGLFHSVGGHTEKDQHHWYLAVWPTLRRIT
jgi:hypothetical protein